MFREVLEGRQWVAPDLPGHGGSRLSPLSMATTIDALATWLAAQDNLGLLIGYSMGGRVALHVALEHPELVPALLLISAGLGIEDDGERAGRLLADHSQAASIERLGVERFVRRWIDHPIAGTQRVPQARRKADLAERLHHDPSALAAALAALSPGAHDPLHNRIASLGVPVTWMAGAADPTYAEIATWAADATGGNLVVVKGSGHNIVLERPRQVRETLSAILDTDSGASYE